MVCRQEGPAADGNAATIRLGVALPPREPGEKRRVDFHATAAALRRTAPALALDDKNVLACAPASWREALRELCAGGAAAGIVWRVFGSLSWQFFGGVNYLTSASDVDLLWEPQDSEQLDAGIAILQQHELRSGGDDGHPRLDGEILFPGNRGVSWREWAATGGKNDAVLVKTAAAVTLETRTALRSMLSPARQILEPAAGQPA